jgi:hypothetical protein
MRFAHGEPTAEFGRQALLTGVDLWDAKACKQLADKISSQISGSSLARHILLHLFFPQQFERTASVSQKQKIVNAFSKYAGGANDVDDALI